MIIEAQRVINLQTTTQYTEWFGAMANNRWQTAQQTITRVRTNQVVAYACDDMANVFAYVYPADATHTIYLCSVFWNVDRIGGYDTQSGTLYHELTHFNNIGGTGDYAYGTTAARNLARTNPANAVMNADNHEYFGETNYQ